MPCAGIDLKQGFFYGREIFLYQHKSFSRSFQLPGIIYSFMFSFFLQKSAFHDEVTSFIFSCSLVESEAKATIIFQ